MYMCIPSRHRSPKACSGNIVLSEKNVTCANTYIPVLPEISNIGDLQKCVHIYNVHTSLCDTVVFAYGECNTCTASQRQDCAGRMQSWLLMLVGSY